MEKYSKIFIIVLSPFIIFLILNFTPTKEVSAPTKMKTFTDIVEVAPEPRAYRVNEYYEGPTKPKTTMDFMKEIKRTLSYSEYSKYLRRYTLDDNYTREAVKIEFTYNGKVYQLDEIMSTYEDGRIYFSSQLNFIDSAGLSFDDLKNFKGLREEILPERDDDQYAEYRTRNSTNTPNPEYKKYQFTVLYNILISSDKEKFLVTYADLNPADSKFINGHDGSLDPINLYTYICTINTRECVPSDLLEKANNARRSLVNGFLDYPYHTWNDQDNLVFSVFRDRWNPVNDIVKHYVIIYDANTDKITQFELNLETMIKK